MRLQCALTPPICICGRSSAESRLYQSSQKGKTPHAQISLNGHGYVLCSTRKRSSLPTAVLHADLHVDLRKKLFYEYMCTRLSSVEEVRNIQSEHDVEWASRTSDPTESDVRAGNKTYAMFAPSTVVLLHPWECGRLPDDSGLLTGRSPTGARSVGIADRGICCIAGGWPPQETWR